MSPWVMYGGTFDPVHHGHLAIARAARDALDCIVHLVPAADPPHRPPPGANAADRSAMLALALADQPGLRLDRRELERHARDPEARSYSIDTLRELRGELGEARPIVLLLGADSFLGLPTWKQWRDLLALAHLAVAPRPGCALDAGLPPELEAAVAGHWADTAAQLMASPAGRLLVLRQPLQPESATALRRRIADGRPWRQLLPAAVADYIVRHGLYGAGTGASPAASL